MRNLEKKLSELRAQIATASTNRSALENASLSRLETEAKIDQFIARQRKEFESFSMSFCRREPIPHGLYAKTSSYGANIAPWLCYLHPEETRAKLIEDLDSENIVFGLPESERVAELAKLQLQIVKLEREEERLVMELQDSGADCQRRSGIQNPLVIALKADVEYHGVHH